MTLKTAEKQIGTVTFGVTQLGALEGSKTLLRLTKAVGPSIASVAQAIMGGAQKTEVLNVVITSLQTLSEGDFEALVKTFAATTKVQRQFTADGKTVTQKLPEVFDDVFGGDYMTLLAWLVFAIEVNYTDFFVGAIRTMGKDEPPDGVKAE